MSSSLPARIVTALHLKTILGVLAALAAGTLIVFGPRSLDSPPPPDRVIVDYWEKWTGEEETQMRQIVDQFNRTEGAKKGIFVRMVSTSGIAQKTLISTAAGDPPDIAGLWVYDLAQFASLGALEPLEDYARASDITSTTYKAVYWNACHWDGHLYALVSTPSVVALQYNRAIFRECAAQLRAAGLDPDRPPRTLAELDAYARVLDKRGPDGRIERAGFLPMEPGWFIAYVYLWFGGDIWDPAKSRFTLTSDRVVESYRWIQSYSKRLGKDAVSEFHGGIGNADSPLNPYLFGSLAMELQGPWIANIILTKKPNLAGLKPGETDDPDRPLADRQNQYLAAVAPFPSAQAGLNNATYAEFDTLVIPRGAKHKKEAFEFMAYINRQDIMERLCEMHTTNSPLMQVSDHFLNHNKNPFIGVYEALARSPNAHTCPLIPIFPEVGDELMNALQRISLLDAEPREALREAQDRMQAKYDAFMERQRARELDAGAN